MKPRPLLFTQCCIFIIYYLLWLLSDYWAVYFSLLTANVTSIGGHMLPMWDDETSKMTMISTDPLPPKCSFILPKRSLRGGSSVRWHQRSISEGNNEEEALGSSYTANNVTGQTVWTMGLWGLSSGEVIMTRLIQQEEDKSMDRRSQGRSHLQ